MILIFLEISRLFYLCKINFDFFAKLKSNLVIFVSVDSSLSPLSSNIKLPNFYHRSIVQFDQIRIDHQEFP